MAIVVAVLVSNGLGIITPFLTQSGTLHYAAPLDSSGCPDSTAELFHASDSAAVESGGIQSCTKRPVVASVVTVRAVPDRG
jgi:hypothetical protein